MKIKLLFLSLFASISGINAQWTSQGTGFTAENRGLSEIRIVDANTVWALAYDGSIPAPPATENPNIQELTMTTNGGDSWTSHVINIGNPSLRITNISPVNGTTAWIGAVDGIDGLGGVYKSTDGGVSWNQQNNSAYSTTGESKFNGVHFFDSNIGLTIGDPTGSGANRKFEVYRTIDGGSNWTSLAASMPITLSGEYGYSGGFKAVGDSFWFTTSKGRLFRSIDKGATWTAITLSIIADFGGFSVPGTSGTIHFSTAVVSGVANGYLLKKVGTTTPVYTYYTTTNGGQSWSAGTTFTGTRYILNYIPGTTTMVATSLQTTPAAYGTSISTDNGAHWTEVESNLQRGASAFLNATTGWCSGFSSLNPLVDGIFKLTSPLSTTSLTAAKFMIYPNPASSIVTISASNVDSYKLSVTDLLGKTLMTKSFTGLENTLDVSSFSKGVYFFELSSDNKKEVVKILKN